MTGWIGLNTLHRPWLETGFFALLPATQQQPAVLNAIEHNQKAISRKLLCLVGAKNSQQAIALAKLLKQHFSNSGLFSELTLQQAQRSYRQNYQHLFPYRFQLLDDATRTILSSRPEQLYQDNLALLYSPFGQLLASNLEHDPLLLFSRYFQSQNPLQLQIEQGVVILKDGDKEWALLLAELRDAELKLDKLEALLTIVDRAREQITTQDGELLATGMPLFTAYGSHSAQQEMSLIGIGSTLGVVILLVFAFRSLKPLLLSCLAVSCGLFAAWVWSLQIFNQLHILTLVFGSSLIGVVVDYALHFICDGIRETHWTPSAGLRYILPGIAFGLFTSLLAFAAIGLSPFPILQQIAIFSAIGLTASWLTVVGLFPVFLSGFRPKVQNRTLQLILYWHRHWPAWLLRHKCLAGTFLLLFIGGGLMQLTGHDDIRLLQSAPEILRHDDAYIRRLLPQAADTQFFLVSGHTESDWYQNERRLLADLELLKQDGVFKQFHAISQNWPNAEQQFKNYRLLKNTLYRPETLQAIMQGLNFSSDAISSEQEAFIAAEHKIISLHDWLALADDHQHHLWLGCDNTECRSIVALSGIKNAATLASLQNLPGVIWVDQVAQLSDTFHHYRLNVLWMLAAVCGLILMILVKWLGWRSGLKVMVVPAVTLTTTLAALGWLAELFTLFNVFALLLVLEIAVDYAIFFHLANRRENVKDKVSSTALAVMLSAMTTLFAFGLLTASHTAIIHAFGITLSVGVLTAFLLAPIVGKTS